MRCENKYCYISNVLLARENISDEHIIPNAMGGHLKSPNLVCKEINNTLFAKLDAILSKSVEIAQLIKFKRDDQKEQPTIIGISTDGMKYADNNMQKGKLLPIKPLKVVDESGKELLKLQVSQKEEYIKSQLKKYPTLKREAIENNLKEVFEDDYNDIHFRNGINIFTTKEPFRAIAKIATNFAVLNNISTNYFRGFIEFIKGGNDLSNIQLGYFYPNELLIYDFEEKEISHILYLKGCQKEKILYCYIELFNTHCFVVNLSYHYHGPTFEKSYIWDVLNAQELRKDIALNLTYSYLSKRQYLWYPNAENDYKERLKRTSLICDLKLRIK